MDQLEPFVSLGAAAAAGMLVGLEREQAAPRHEATGSFIGGARTHPLVALVGGVSMLLAREVGWAAPVAAFAAMVVFLTVNYADDVRRIGEKGLTSEAAFLLSFLMGALATSRVLQPVGHRVVVGAVAVVATLLLSAKAELHPFVRQVSHDDVLATVKFLIVAVVALPLLPDRDLGPYGVLNPRSLGWLVVLISGISFVGYAAVRWVGAERGLGFTGLVGGLASSTAVTLSMSARARAEPALAVHCALAVAAASTVMCARVAVLVGVLNADLLPALAWPLAGMGLGGLSASLWLRSRAEAQPAAGALRIGNPFELSTAMKFAVLFAVVLVGSRFAADRLGSSGVYVAGLVAGTTDLDAVAISMARMAGGGVATRVAATGIVLAIVSNTVVKLGMAWLLGEPGFRRKVGAAFAAMVAGGAAGLAAAWLV